ncbi:MAG: hypothetical protein KDD66_09170 [Bdellovibrionales bacterium]|nr:hypothetical protein [Bdellovibrionales bacterium]
MTRPRRKNPTWGSERGSAEFSAMIGGVSSALAVGPGTHTVFALCLLAVLAVVLLSIVGYSIHMLVLGSSSKKQLRRGFQSRLLPLEQLIDEAKANIWRFESALESGTRSISPHCIELLGTLRRIVMSAENHLRLIRKLTENGGHSQLLIAEEKLTAAVPMRDNCLEALIDEDPLPHRAIEDWVPHIRSLIDEIDHGLTRRIAA